MGDKFQGDAAWLNGTAFGQLLLEIGKQPVSNLPKDPELAFIARVHAWADQHRQQFERMSIGERERNVRKLRTAGLIRDIPRVHAGSWRERLACILRGMIRFSKDQAEISVPESLAA